MRRYATGADGLLVVGDQRLLWSLASSLRLLRSIRNITTNPTAGIDPVSGRIWFGPSAKAIVAQLAAEGLTIPLYFLRIGRDVYLRKGSQRC